MISRTRWLDCRRHMTTANEKDADEKRNRVLEIHLLHYTSLYKRSLTAAVAHNAELVLLKVYVRDQQQPPTIDIRNMFYNYDSTR
jgi:hypothetical protein